MKEVLPNLVTIFSVLVTGGVAYFLGIKKSKADARKSDAEAESNIAKLYKESAEYWKTLYDKERQDKEAAMESQLKDRKEKQKLEDKIDELERKIDKLTSQIKEFSLKYNQTERDKN